MQEVIDDAFEGRVSVFDISEIEHIRLMILLKESVIVGTIATYALPILRAEKFMLIMKILSLTFQGFLSQRMDLNLLKMGLIKERPNSHCKSSPYPQATRHNG